MQLNELLDIAEKIRNKDVDNMDYHRLAIVIESLYNLNSDQIAKVLTFIDELYD